MNDQQQFIRKASLLVLKPDTTVGKNYDNKTQQVLPHGVDLSELHFQFKTSNADEQGPSNCFVRVFNLSESTVQKLIRFNYSRLVLQAGYVSSFGVIFTGDIKQFRVGKLNNKDTYLDILAADGDLGYNYAVVNTTLSAAENTRANVISATVKEFEKYGITKGDSLISAGGTQPRGKVMFGMARAHLEDLCASTGSTWSIQNGKIQIIPLNSYLPGEAVKLTSATGLIEIPEQTQVGVMAKCLLNPKIRVGGRVQIDNASIKQAVNQSGLPGTFIPFNQWVGNELPANVARDGFYRVYVAEHEGDTRGPAWWTNLTCLAIDNTSKNVKPYG